MPVFQLTEEILFPPVELAEPDGLLAIGGDLSPERILTAYSEGIFPWYGEGEPILWWSPAPRLVLFPEEYHPSKRLCRTVKQKVFSVTADEAFTSVVTRCSIQRSPNRSETWITDDMVEAYSILHDMGYAHSIECWQAGELVGGLYGIALGQVFFGESMFSSVNNSSKVALFHLIQHSLQTGICIIDCQVKTEHLVSHGAREISRSCFLGHLKQNLLDLQPQKKWRLL